MEEVYCEPCRALLDAGDGIDTRQCALCSATVCRHSARKASVRQGEGEWQTKVVCLEWTSCLTRHAKEIIK